MLTALSGVLLGVCVLGLLRLLPTQPVIYGESGRLCIGRSLLARALEAVCLIVWGLVVGYVAASMVVSRSIPSLITGFGILAILAMTGWLIRRRIIRTTLVVDREQDQIMQGPRLIARASDVQAVHVGSRRHPAVLVLRDRTTRRLSNSALPRLERDDSHVVGSMLAGYLEVALMRVELQPTPASTSGESGAAA